MARGRVLFCKISTRNLWNVPVVFLYCQKGKKARLGFDNIRWCEIPDKKISDRSAWVEPCVANDTVSNVIFTFPNYSVSRIEGLTIKTSPSVHSSFFACFRKLRRKFNESRAFIYFSLFLPSCPFKAFLFPFLANMFVIIEIFNKLNFFFSEK